MKKKTFYGDNIKKAIDEVFDLIYYDADTGKWVWKGKEKFRVLHPDHIKGILKQKIFGDE